MIGVTGKCVNFTTVACAGDDFVEQNRFYGLYIMYSDLHFYSINVSIPKKDETQLYPFVYCYDGTGGNKPCVAHPFWPIIT